MTTSGSTNYSDTTLAIIKDAYVTLNIYREDESLTPEDYSFASRVLNRMVKKWQAADNHLWTKTTATIFLQKGQSQYILNSSGANATTSYTETSLDADYALGVSQVSFSDEVSATAGDYIGIVLDGGSIYWDTISNVVDADTVDLTGTLSGAASEDNAVYIYTNKLDPPFNVYSAIRRSSDGIDTPMHNMSYEEYFQQPNKDSLSTPVNYSYDRQLSSAIIKVWPTPSDVTYRMQITLARKIDDFDSSVNEPDFPQEWYDALVLNLAAHPSIAFSHGKASGDSYAQLKIEAKESLQEALLFDNEPGSLYFQPEWSR